MDGDAHSQTTSRKVHYPLHKTESLFCHQYSVTPGRAPGKEGSRDGGGGGGGEREGKRRGRERERKK